jgi:dipeptidase D
VNLPGGIQRMSLDIPGLVQTSLNLGILNTYDTEVKLVLAIRSSVGTEKDEVFSRVVSLITLLGGTVDRLGDYPAWEYNHNSKLRDLMTQVFEDQYGRKPVVQALHAGVECGLFAGKLPGLDCVSFGPDMMDIHTPQERLSVASVERTWNYLLEILKRLA